MAATDDRPDPVERGVFDDPAALAAADARAFADVEAGRVIDHDAVVRWLAGWGSDDPWAPLR